MKEKQSWVFEFFFELTVDIIICIFFFMWSFYGYHSILLSLCIAVAIPVLRRLYGKYIQRAIPNSKRYRLPLVKCIGEVVDKRLYRYPLTNYRHEWILFRTQDGKLIKAYITAVGMTRELLYTYRAGDKGILHFRKDKKLDHYEWFDKFKPDLEDSPDSSNSINTIEPIDSIEPIYPIISNDQIFQSNFKESKEKLKIISILKESFELYKNHFKKLFIFSTIAMSSAIGVSLYSFLNSFKTLQFFTLPLFLISMSFLIMTVRSQLAAQIYLSDSINGTATTIRESFDKTRGKTGRFISRVILLTLLISALFFGALFLSIIALAFTDITYEVVFAQFRTNQSLIIELFMWVVSPLTFFLPPITALEDRNSPIIKNIFKLIKGNYFKLLPLIFISYTLWQFPKIIAKQFITKTPLSVFLIAITSHILLIFIYAFSYAVKFVVYKKIFASKK